MKMLDRMHFRVLDSNFSTVSILENYDSVLWFENYNDVGEIEIHGKINDDLLRIANKDFYILNSLSTELMMIESVKENYDSEEGQTLTLSGKAISSVMNRRVLYGTASIINPMATPLDIYISETLTQLIDASFGPEDPSREWTGMTTSFPATTSQPVLEPGQILQFNIGENLLNVVVDMCKSYGLGFRTAFDLKTKMVKISIYQGVDRTLPENGRVIFSDIYDNLATTSDTLDFSPEKNTALVVGGLTDDETGLPLHPVTVTTGETGFNRKEIFYTASSTGELITGPGENDHRPMTVPEYQSALTLEGSNELNKSTYRPIRNFDGEILETPTHTYGLDYSLGDIVYMGTPIKGLQKLRLNRVLFSDDTKNGKTIVPSFVYENGVS